MVTMLDTDDLAELHRLIVRLLEAIERGDLEASPTQRAALSGAALTVRILQQSDI